ncbi:hypothetical protein D5086_002291 [Populus alba]|uniref:Uncharacterized protein n=1 Tax=Populus alba TaxID=43335 RepID=A0ACC4D3D5_POPAL
MGNLSSTSKVGDNTHAANTTCETPLALARETFREFRKASFRSSLVYILAAADSLSSTVEYEVKDFKTSDPPS